MERRPWDLWSRRRSSFARFRLSYAGKDLIGTAQTGTGKTAAFALPILTLLAKHGGLRCLVLEPTRELAAQVETAFRDYGRFTDLRVRLVHGGVGYGKQRDESEARRRHSGRNTGAVAGSAGAACDESQRGKNSRAR